MTTGKPQITPHLWFDTEAREAAEFYTSLFPDSKVTNVTTVHNTPSNHADIVSFVLSGQAFMAISAGPMFKINPSISLYVDCQTKDEVERLWAKLLEGGAVLMELGAYPWSEKYGWLQDKFGLSWQLIFVDGREINQKITPMLLFVGSVCGKAEEAIGFYASVFDGSQVNAVTRYGKDELPDKEGTVKYAVFTLQGQEFRAMDSAFEHPFAFNEAVSLIVSCDTQEEIDDYWEKLSAVPEAEACGWLKDRFGVSWQITPTALDEMMTKGTREQIDRLTQVILPMKKLDLAQLKKAYEG